ncbi:titin isoform X2 [Diabrotica virgifera virgifera]|uniref:PHD finger protein 10 n=1 Tax=Diabrotica virgifera virgifera TaxID=50390 RepID=A0ABM5III8_DIAVI|nr:titin isoform X2 [Diabrotica virgifera virgifera]
MNNKVVGGEIMKVPSSDNVNELLEMPVPNEKITEDVEDLVHDLESLLGKTSQSFDAQIRPKTADDSKSSSDEVTEKIKDDEGIKNNENIESNSSLDISSKETIENKDVNSEEGCNQLEIENKTTEISSQSPTFAKDEIGVEENLPICDNMNTTVDPTIDSKHSNEREPLVSEELSIDTENNSAVDNPLITIEVNKDIISDAKSNEINELTNDDSTSSWEIVDLNEAMALESSVSSTPSDNIEQPVNTIANSQNVLDDITSSGDKAGTSLLRMDTEENREADSIQVEATDQVDRKLDLITENIEKLEGASKVTGIGLVNKDTESDSSKVIISEDEDKCVNEVKGLDVTSCEAEAVPFEIEESDNATTSEKTKDVELQMEISSSEVSVQQEETQLQNTEDEPSNLEAVGSSENPKNLEDIVKLDKSDNLEISKEDLSCNAENSLTDDIAISKESVDVNHLDSAIPELTPENIQPDVEDGATSEVIVAKETDVTSHIVENIESVSETEEPNEKSNSDIVESVRESSEIKEVTAEDTESKIYDNTRQENENKSDIKLYESKGSEIISVEDLPELENTIGDTKPMDVEPDEKNLSENDQSEQESHSPDQTDSDITKAVEQTLNNPELESPQATKEAGSELLTPEEENTKSRTNEKVDEDVKIDTNTGEEVVMETEQVNVNEIQEIKTKEEETDDVVTEKVHIQADVEGAGGSSKETDNIKEDIKSDIKDICEAEEKTKQVESDLEETLEGRTDLVEPKEVLVELQEIKDDAEVTDDMKTDDVENDECKTCIKETDINLDIQQTDQVQSDVEMTELVKTDMEKNRQVEIGEGMSKTDVEETKDTQNITKTDKDDSELDQETCKVIEYIDEKGVVETEEPEITDSEKAAPINADQMDVEFVKVSTEESEQIETDDVVVLEPQTEQKLSDNVEAQASEVEDDTKSDIDISRSPTHQDLLEKNEDIEMSQASEIGMDNPEGDSALPIQSEKELNENISDDVEQIQSSGAIKDSSESDKDDSRLQTNEELSENIGDVQESPSSEVINDTTEADKDTSISHTEELPEKIEKVMEASPSSAFIQDATETDTDISRSQNEGDLTETIEDFEESQSKEVINDTTEADTNVSKSQTDELSNTNEEVMEGSISTALIQDATEADKETEDLSNSEKIDEEDVEKTQSSVIINDEIEKVETVLEDSQPHEAIGDTTEDVATNEVSEKVESVLEDSQPNEVIGDTTEAVSVYEPEKELSKEINNIKEPPQSSEITKDDTESVETSQEISSMQIDEVFDPVEVIQEESEACVEFGKNMDEPNLEANQDEEKMEVESDPSANESEASTSEKVVCESVPETSFKEEEEKSTSVTTTDNKVEEFSVSGTQEHSQNEVLKHNKEKPKSSEKSKKHRKSERSDNFEELTINVDVSEKEKTYSPKVTIKPIKVPDEEVSTTTSITADSEISKGSLKMTITKQSDNTHSILKISDQEHSEAVLEPEEEPIPKLIIKPKIQQVEQQHSPKMSTRSSKQSPTSSNQSAISPRITIKPVVKQQEPPVSPLKIKINTKANTKVTAKDEESGRKTSIKSAAKSNEDAEPLQSPRITIKPIPKPDSEKETNPRLTIKPIKKSEEDVANEEKERTSPKITIKPIVKPQELESVPSQEEEEVKERIVLKINKGNLPLSPAKDPKKREHLTDEDKSERLAKITVKFSKEGGHHIVHQGDDNPLKRPQEELPVPEKNKKQKVDTDSVVSTRSTRNKEYHEGGEIKSNSATESKVSHRDQSLECPIEAKRSRKENINDKLKQKENDNAEIQIIESKVDSPITISEDSRSQDSGSVILLDDGKDDSISSIDAGKNVSLRGSLSVAKSNTPSPVLRKRGRPKRSLSPAGDQPKEVEPIAEKEAATQKKKLGRPRKTISPPKEKEPEPVAVEPATETDSATASPVPKKKMGRPRKVPLEPREDFKNPEDSPKLKEAEKPIESGRPKRSCRGGQSICDTLGIKPRKSRGSGRGRGSMRGAGNRSLTERDSFTGTLKEEEVSTSDKDKNPKSTENPSDKAGPSDKSKLGKAGGFTPTREVIVILDEAIPDKKSTVKETANIIRKSTEKSVQPDIIAIPDKKSMVKETANRIRKSTEKSVEPDIIAIPDKKSTVKETANRIRKSTEKSVEPDIAIPDKKSTVKETANRIRKSTEKSVEPDIAIPDKKSTVKETANIIRKSAEKSVEPDIIAIPDKKSTVKETANIIRKSAEKSVEPDIIEIESEDSQLSEKGSETTQNVKENQEDLKVTPEEPVQLMEVDSVETETSFEKKIPLHEEKSETDIKGSSTEKDEVETGKSVLDADGKSSPSILAPPATPKLFSQLGTSLPKSSNPEISSVSCSSTSIPSEVMIVDEETRMSAETNSRAQTPAKQVVTSSDIVEESQSSVHSTGTTESGKTPSRPSKAPRLEVQEPDTNVITADLLSEYYWKGNGPFMLQEQVAQFLGIKSFKRKYPGIMRRMLDMQERDYIREQGLASENMCDLGLTAVNAADILDIMYTDFQEKYEEYCKHQRDRQAKELINKQKALSLAAAQDKCKADITEQAVHSAAQWNARFNKTRKESRKTCMDLQNLTVHYPKGKMVPAIPAPHPGNYPVALVPGQFAEFYQEFTPTELNNLPINTMGYNEVTFIPREESDDSSSDGSESDSDSSGSSSSSSDSDSSSGVEDCKLCKHSPKKVTPATTTVVPSGTPATPVK